MLRGSPAVPAHTDLDRLFHISLLIPQFEKRRTAGECPGGSKPRPAAAGMAAPATATKTSARPEPGGGMNCIQNCSRFRRVRISD